MLAADDATDRWLRAELCRDALREIATVLDANRVRLLAIKGVHLAFAVAKDPWYRPIADADAIVLDGQYSRAIDLVCATGRWKVRRDDWSSSAVIDARGRGVDLHRAPLPAFFGRFRLEAMTERAVPRPDLFGPSVLVPAPG